LSADAVSAIPASLKLGGVWRTALPALLVLLGAIVALYWGTAVAMVEIWSRSDTFAHAYMVLPISLWLIWRQRNVLAALTPRPQPWVLLPMLLVGAFWLLADLVVVNAAAQFALVGLLVMAVPAMLGLEVTLAILFPLMFLFFAVPFGEFLLPVLMEYTANFTVMALRLSGIPVYREGLQFVIPSGNWSVVEACSGVRYLIASFMIGTLFAYLNYRSMRRRLAFMCVSIVVPIVANWLRAYMIVMLGHFSGNTIAVGVDHLIYGWVFFGVVIMIMFLIGARWAEPDAVADGALPVSHPLSAGYRVGNVRVAGTLLACVVVVLLPQLAASALQGNEADVASPRLSLPAHLADGWQAGGSPAAVAWQPRFANPSLETRQVYTAGNHTVGVYVAYYRGQGPDRKLVSSQNMLVGPQDHQWNLVASGRRSVHAGDRTLTFQTAELLGAPLPGTAQRQQVVVWRLYWIDGALIAGDAAAKLAGAMAQLRGHGDDGAAIVLYAAGESHMASTAALEAFVKTNLKALEALLRRARDAN
jgi:exosortase A